MPNVSINNDIAQYIREYHSLCSREVIFSGLRSQGYTLADIEAAWAAIEAESPRTPGQPGPRNTLASNDFTWNENAFLKPVFWLTAPGFVILSFGLSALLTYATENADFGKRLLGLAPMLFIALQLAAGVVATFEWNHHRALAQGLFFGVLANMLIFFVEGLLTLNR